MPALIGLAGRVNVLTTDIFLDTYEKVPPDLGYASAFFLVVLLYSRTSSSGSIRPVEKCRASPHRDRAWISCPALSTSAGASLGGGIWCNSFRSASPTTGLVWLSVMPFTPGQRLGVHLATLHNYRVVLQSNYYLELIWKTLMIAAGSATRHGAHGGCRLARGTATAGAWLLDQLATLPLVFPGIVLGVAVMQLFLNSPIPFYGTIWIIMGRS